ncbi:hypothetical protein ScPMuIL_002358 [Solemya velum]
MKTGYLALILVCAVCFDLVFAQKCAEIRDKCLKVCKKAIDPGVCKETCRANYQRCVRFEKQKKNRDGRRSRKKGRNMSNAKRAVISLGLEAIQTAIGRLNPKIIRMGTN